MIVYRIEKENNIGPYRVSDNWTNRNHASKSHPNMFVDYFDLYADMVKLSDYYFGFDSLEKVYDWFDEFELKKLKDIGFFISVYNIDSNFVLEGESKKQIMFKLKEADLLKIIE